MTSFDLIDHLTVLTVFFSVAGQTDSGHNKILALQNFVELTT